MWLGIGGLLFIQILTNAEQEASKTVVGILEHLTKTSDTSTVMLYFPSNITG